MDWSKSSNEIWDPIRSRYVLATPEEKVRQKLIQKMIGELGFPKGLIAVEKDLETGRRFDLVCYAHAQEGIRPLLLVECKALHLGEQTFRQAEGYNHWVGAPFLCYASDTEIKTFWYEKNKIAFVSFLPKFSDLVSKL